MATCSGGGTNLTNLRRHGSPEDRGSADKYYGRRFNPHYYVGDSYNSSRIERKDMTPKELVLYRRGWEEETDKKDWGIDEWDEDYLLYKKD